MMKTIKKIALCMAAFLTFAVPGACPVPAEEEYVTLQNPGFEASDTAVTGWSNNSPAQISVDTTKRHSGNNSLKINNVDDDNPWIKQQVWNLQSYAMYELGAYVNVDIADTTQGGIGFKIEQYDASDRYIKDGAYDNPRFNTNTNNRWVYHGLLFQVHPDAVKIALYIRSYTPGVVWYDDITLKYSGGPEPYSFFADHVFHYPDEETGTAVVTLDPFYEADGAEATNVTVRFCFLDGETVLDKKENVSFTNRKAVYTYPVSLMTEKKKKYNLKTEITDTTGTVIRSWTENMYLYDRPTLMPENGKFIIDGEPFYPIIGYHTEYADYARVPESGINTIMLGNGISVAPQRKKWVAEMERVGLRGIACLYAGMKPAFHPDNISSSIATINALKDNPNIIAWAVMDEPLGAGLDMETMKGYLEKSYIRIRELDPTRPVYLLDYGNHKETAKYCDVFVADVYCRGDTAISVSQILEPLQKVNTRVSAYELAAAFSSGGVFPPTKTIRASVYRGLEAGRSFGTGFYGISVGVETADGNKPLYTIDTWNDITKICKEELPVLFPYFGGDDGKQWNRSKTGDEYKEFYWETWRTDDGRMYLLAHNRGEDRVIKNIPLTNAAGTVSVGTFTARPIGLTQNATSGNGSLAVTLSKEDIVLYEIIPQTLRYIPLETADMYAGVYKKDGKKLLQFYAAKNSSRGVEVPALSDSNVRVEIYTFVPGTMHPREEKRIYTK